MRDDEASTLQVTNLVESTCEQVVNEIEQSVTNADAAIEAATDAMNHTVAQLEERVVRAKEALHQAQDSYLIILNNVNEALSNFGDSVNNVDDLLDRQQILLSTCNVPTGLCTPPADCTSQEIDIAEQVKKEAHMVLPALLITAEHRTQQRNEAYAMVAQKYADYEKALEYRNKNVPQLQDSLLRALSEKQRIMTRQEGLLKDCQPICMCKGLEPTDSSKWYKFCESEGASMREQ